MNQTHRSLVLITVDCLRADHCGFYGYSGPTTPFLDSLALHSFVVPTAIVAGAPTYYSLPAILACRMPLALGRDVIGLAPGENTLATTLRDAGYATAAFSAANPYISSRFGYDQGFETFEDFLQIDSVAPVPTPGSHPSSPPAGLLTTLNASLKSAAHAAALGRLYDDLYFQYRLRVAASPIASFDALRQFPSAEEIVRHAIQWLESAAERPFFLWLHLMDPHSPYCPSPSAFREVTGRDVEPAEVRYLNEYWNRSDLTPVRLARKKKAIVDLYDAGIRSADDQIARLVSGLERAGKWDQCVFVVTADHGEEFLEHGLRYHAPRSLYEEVVRVPLLMRVPGAAKPEVPRSPFSHLDLAPTLLEILDMPAPESFQGRSLWSNLQRPSAWDDVVTMECVADCTNPFHRGSRNGARLLAVRDARYKLVRRFESEAVEELFDLDADPKEQQPLPLGANRDVRRNLLQRAHAHLKKTARCENATVRLRARLRDLQLELMSKSRQATVHLAGSIRA